MGLEGLFKGYGKRSVLSEFPTLHNIAEVLQGCGFSCEGWVRTVL